MAEQEQTELQGVSPHSVTSTGRVTLKKTEGEAIRCAAEFTPAQITDKAPCPLVLTQDPDGCILAFLPGAWDTFSAQIEDLPVNDIDAADLRRMYIGPAEDVSIDGQDRIKLSKNLRGWAGLSEDGASVLLVDTGVRYELWEESAYREYLKKRSSDLKSVMRDIGNQSNSTEDTDGD